MVLLVTSGCSGQGKYQVVINQGAQLLLDTHTGDLDVIDTENESWKKFASRPQQE
jgi:hypothetical protein